MIKVLHFVSTPAIWSGVMNVIMNYYRHMDRSRIQFDFLCFVPCKNQQESYEREIEELGGRVYYIPKPTTISAFFKLNIFFQQNAMKYTWLHNHEVYLSALLKLVANRNGMKNFIIHSHATRYSDHRLAALRNHLLCLPIPFMECKHFACSKAAGNFLYGRHCSFHVLPNTIDKTQYLYNADIRNSYRKQLNINSNFVIGHIGRFVPQKNHQYLITVFSAIQEQIPEARLLLIGDGPLKDDIRHFVQSRHLKNKIVFLGKRDDVPCLLQAMDIFLLPSIYEGLPISCLEAQAAGLPCLISDSVSKEICLSSHVKMLSLKATDLWVKNCVDFQVSAENSSEIFDRSWNRQCPDNLPDIIEEAQKLADFYLAYK